jgi:hypothetical protein
MDKTFFCIDNFYKDPDQIRHNVLSGTGFSWFPDKTSYSFPNGNAPFLGKMTRERYVPDHQIDLTVGKLLGKNVAPIMKKDHGCFRLTCKSEVNNMFTHSIHADGITDKDWAGVLYLTPVTEEIEGTILYKNTVLNKTRFSEREDYDVIQRLGNDNPEQWQKELVSYFVYNRLVVYRADLFHAPGPAFGIDDESGRLIQLFMWEEL